MIVGLLLRWAVNVAALWVAAEALDGVRYEDLGSLVVAALVFGLVNFAVRPLVTILAIPLIILTLGIAYFFVNLLMLLLTEGLVSGFEIDGFWSAVAATVIVWLVNAVLGFSARRRPARSAGSDGRGARARRS